MARTGKTAKRPTGKVMKKAKRMISKQRKTKAKKNMDTFFFKAKTVIGVKPQQGIATSNYLSVWFPILDSGTSAFSVTNNTEFNLYRTLYDKVRINSIKITVTPKANVLDAGQAQNDTAYNLTGDGVVHHVVDRDDCPPANIARLSRYPSYRKTSQLKSFSRMYSVKYPTGIWLDCQGIYADTTLLNRLGLTGGIYTYAENILEDNLEILNEPFAQVTIEWNCVFQGKTSGALSYDPDTGIVQVKPTDPALVLANTPVVAVMGTIADRRTDASGNLVHYTDESTV